jgi:Bax protein
MNAASFKKSTVLSLGALAFTLSGAVSDGGAPVRVAMTTPIAAATGAAIESIETAAIDMDREAERFARIEPAAAPASVMLRSVTSTSLYQQFTERGYTLEAVRDDGEAVPRVFLAQLPRDLPALPSPDFRKTVFIKMMLPLVLAENERIRKDRARALELRAMLEEDAPVSAEQMAWLAELASRYGVDDGNLDELFKRVDVVPPALALAQAALETGWGTSNVAQRGHAMFGQMVFRIDESGTIAEVKMFDSLAAAVQAYAYNLNTHRAYAEFRKVRTQMRSSGRVIDGYELANHLIRYSERKLDYVQAVRGLIRFNKLQAFDQARLDG